MPMAPLSAQWKSQDIQGECLAHGVQHNDTQQGDRSRSYATPIIPLSETLVSKMKKGN
jgi:hypothetical protein